MISAISAAAVHEYETLERQIMIDCHAHLAIADFDVDRMQVLIV